MEMKEPMNNVVTELGPERRAMISQPMNGLTDEEIKETRAKAVQQLTDMGYEVIDSFFSKPIVLRTMEDNIAVKKLIMESDNDVRVEDYSMNPAIKAVAIEYLSAAIFMMSHCDAVYFCSGWDTARGCVIEHSIAERYGLTCIYNESDTEPENIQTADDSNNPVTTVEISNELADKLSDLLARQAIRQQQFLSQLHRTDKAVYELCESRLVDINLQIDNIKAVINSTYIPGAYKFDEYYWVYNGKAIDGTTIKIYKS